MDCETESMKHHEEMERRVSGVLCLKEFPEGAHSQGQTSEGCHRIERLEKYPLNNVIKKGIRPKQRKLSHRKVVLASSQVMLDTNCT